MTVLAKPYPFLDVEVGAMDDIRQWFQLLRDAGADVSDFAKQSFLATSFVPQAQAQKIALGRVSVGEYGFPSGASYRALLEQGHARGEVLPWETALPACYAYAAHPKGMVLHLLTDPAPIGSSFDGILKLYCPNGKRAVHFRNLTSDGFFEPREELIVRIR